MGAPGARVEETDTRWGIRLLFCNACASKEPGSGFQQENPIQRFIDDMFLLHLKEQLTTRKEALEGLMSTFC
jgi:hypothetical protein